MGKSKITLKKSKNLNKKIIDIISSVSIQRLSGLAFFFFIIVLLTCSGTPEKNKTLSVKNEYQSIAVAKYQGNIQYLFNQNRSQVICLQSSKPTGLKPHPALDFFIYDISKEGILFEDSLINAKVSWISNSQVQVEFIPEIISEDEAPLKSGYIFDVNIMKKTPLNPDP